MDPKHPTPPHPSTRRAFLSQAARLGALLGASSLASACADDTRRAASNGPDGSDVGADVGEDAPQQDEPCPPPPDPIADAPDGALDLGGMPYRQDDPRWTNDIMWDRDLVLQAAVELNGESPEDAEALMREFENGNTIGNEGCLLTCLAMVMRLLIPEAQPTWTPSLLNELAHYFYYYTPSGLSLTTLYADLVSDSTIGEVQLALKEEYLPAQPGWSKVHVHTSTLVRAYRRLPPAKRAHFLLILKTGTYDDTVASHYALLHPDDPGTPDDPDPLLLDPAQPLDMAAPWRMSDSAAWITTDPEIGAAWERDGIEPTQLAGVWVFARWRGGRSSLAPLIHAWGAELAAQAR